MKILGRRWKILNLNQYQKICNFYDHIRIEIFEKLEKLYFLLSFLNNKVKLMDMTKILHKIVYVPDITQIIPLILIKKF